MLKPIKTLLIEDDQSSADLISEFLRQNHCRASVCHVGSIKESVDCLKNETFDVILLDLTLPDSEGMNTLDSITRVNTVLPIVILTGLNDESLAVEMIKKGAQDYLVKGQFNSSLLMRVIQYAIERKIIEQALRISEQEWRKTFNAISDRIFIQDEDFRIVKMNKAFAQTMKLNPEDIFGKKCHEVLHGSDQPIPQCPCVKTRCDGISHCEEILDTETGQSFQVTTSPIIENSLYKGAVHIARDITSQKKTDEELKDIQAQLLQLEKMAVLGQMSAGITHEIKNPLSTILLSIDCIKTKMGGKDPIQIKELLNLLEESAQRINKVINELLSFVRTPNIKVQRVNLHRAIDTAISLLDNKARHKNVICEKYYSKEDIEINADKLLIEQVFYNLLSNAVDAMEPGGRIKLRTECPGMSGGEMVDVEISDTGCGMTDEEIVKIFEPFFTTKDYGKGTGLGLSIVKMVVEKHKGSINVVSQKGSGTSFTVSLPVSAG